MVKGIEWQQRIERTVDLRFIAVLFLPPNVQGNAGGGQRRGRQNTREPPLALTELLADCSVAVH